MSPKSNHFRGDHDAYPFLLKLHQFLFSSFCAARHIHCQTHGRTRLMEYPVLPSQLQVRVVVVLCEWVIQITLSYIIIVRYTIFYLLLVGLDLVQFERWLNYHQFISPKPQRQHTGTPKNIHHVKVTVCNSFLLSLHYANKSKSSDTCKALESTKSFLRCAKISWTLVHKRLKTGPEFFTHCQWFCCVDLLDLAFWTVWRSSTQWPRRRWPSNCTWGRQQSCWSDWEVKVVDNNKFWLTCVRLLTSSRVDLLDWTFIFVKAPLWQSSRLCLAVNIGPSSDHQQWSRRGGDLRTGRHWTTTS